MLGTCSTRQKRFVRAKKVLEDKALRLLGAPNTMAAVAGRTPAASIFLTGKADALIYYCSGDPDDLHEIPGLVSRHLPANLDVVAVYGLAMLSEHPDAQRLALFLLSEKGQAILAKHGFIPLADDDQVPIRATGPSKDQLNNTDHGLLLQRDGGAPRTVSLDQLGAYPRVTQRVTQKTSRGEETTEWSGPLLWDVLTSAGLVDPAKHGEHPHLMLRATGRDGYTVAVAIAELSADFAGAPVIIADHMNGTLLPRQSLRLIVPGDRRAGRSVRDLTRITVDQ
jgi:hypothetical protein